MSLLNPAQELNIVKEGLENRERKKRRKSYSHMIMPSASTNKIK